MSDRRVAHGSDPADPQPVGARLPSSARSELVARLPFCDSELETQAAALGASSADLAWLRQANRQAALLSALPRPELPTELADGSLLERIYEEAAASFGDRLAALPRPKLPDALRDGSLLERVFETASSSVAERLRIAARDDSGRSLAAGLAAPLRAPHDVDWAAAALEHLVDDSSIPDVAAELVTNPPATPGWLWLRIRSELRSLRSQVTEAAPLPDGSSVAQGSPHLSSSPRRPSGRAGSGRAGSRWVRIAAVVVVGTGVAIGIGSIGAALFADRGVVAPRIVFQSVDQPLDGSFSVSAIVAEVRRGAR